MTRRSMTYSDVMHPIATDSLLGQISLRPPAHRELLEQGQISLRLTVVVSEPVIDARVR
jgi:hypothetical protein